MVTKCVITMCGAIITSNDLSLHEVAQMRSNEELTMWITCVACLTKLGIKELK